jgi:hypothetical protein
MVLGRRVLEALRCTTLVFVASPALATPEFPETIQEALNMPCVPQCVLCHLTPSGGPLNYRFGDTLSSYGQVARPHDRQSLRDALENIENNPSKPGGQADGDGVSDIEELRRGDDPNVDGAGNLCGPRYGCGARIAPHGAPDSLGALSAVVVAAALALAMRRLRKSPAR